MASFGVTGLVMVVPVNLKSVDECRREWCRSRTDAAEGRETWDGRVGLSARAVGETGEASDDGSIFGVCIRESRLV